MNKPMTDDLGSPQSDELPRQGRLCGVDFGTVRVGLALCDPGQSIASPLETYTRINPDRDAQYFSKLAHREDIVGWVVGLPVHMSGDTSEKSREAVAFGRWLRDVTGLPVAWVDERLTTSRAHELLSESGLRGRARKSRLDKIAAQILLTIYLENGSTDRPASY